MHRLGRKAQRERLGRDRGIVQLALTRLQAGKGGWVGAGGQSAGAVLSLSVDGMFRQRKETTPHAWVTTVSRNPRMGCYES